MLEAIWDSWVLLGIVASPILVVYLRSAQLLRGYSPVMATTASLFLQALVFWTIVLFWRGVPVIDPLFWPLAVFASLFLITAVTLGNAAVQRADMSLVSPYYALTPALVFILAWLLLGQAITGWGFIGLSCIGVGTYLLNLKPSTWRDVFKPVQMFRNEFDLSGGRWRESGVCLAVLSSFCYAPSFVLGPAAIERADIWFYGACITTGMFLWGTLFMWWKDLRFQRVSVSPMLAFSVAGVILGITVFRSLEIGDAAYVAAIRRCGTLAVIVYGMVFLKERDYWKTRAIAAMFMIIGAALITFF